MFSSGIFQNCLVFIPAKRYIKYFNGTSQIYSQKSNGMSEESIENITKSNSFFAPTLVNYYIFLDVNYKSMYFLHTKSMVKRFKHSFYIK